MNNGSYNQEKNERERILRELDNLANWRKGYRDIASDSNKVLKLFEYLLEVENLYAQYLLRSQPLTPNDQSDFKQMVRELDKKYQILENDPDYKDIKRKLESRVGELQDVLLSLDETTPELELLHQRIRELELDMAKSEITNRLEQVYDFLQSCEFEAARQAVAEVSQFSFYLEEQFQTRYTKQSLEEHLKFFKDVLETKHPASQKLLSMINKSKEDQSITDANFTFVDLLEKTQKTFSSFKEKQPLGSKLDEAELMVYELLGREKEWNKKYNLKNFQFHPLHELKHDIKSWRDYMFGIKTGQGGVGQRFQSALQRFVPYLALGSFISSCIVLAVMIVVLVQNPFLTKPSLGLATPTSESSAEVSPEPVAEVSPEPVAEVSPEPAAEVSPEPAAEVSPEPAAEVSPEPAAEVSPEPAAEVSTLPVTFELAPEICPHVKDADGNDIFFDAPPLKITFKEGATLKFDPAKSGQLLDSSDQPQGTLQVMIDGTHQENGGIFVNANDNEKVKMITSGMCKLPENDDPSLYWIPAQFLTYQIAEKQPQSAARFSKFINCEDDNQNFLFCPSPLTTGDHKISIELDNASGQLKITEHRDFPVTDALIKGKPISKLRVDTTALEDSVACVNAANDPCGNYDIWALYKQGGDYFAVVRPQGNRGIFWARVNPENKLGLELSEQELEQLTSSNANWVILP